MVYGGRSLNLLFPRNFDLSTRKNYGGQVLTKRFLRKFPVALDIIGNFYGEKSKFFRNAP